MKKTIFGIALLGVLSTLSAGVISQNGVAKDSATGLMWQDDNDAKTIEKDWEGAKSYCGDLTLGGFSDWRLPNIYELVTLVDNTDTKISDGSPRVIDGIKNIVTSGYWSSNTHPSKSSYVWNMYFYYGGDSWSRKKDSYYVRCVRAGQLNFDNLVILKNQGKLKVSQKNIDEISPEEETRIKKEAEIFAKKEADRKESIKNRIERIAQNTIVKDRETGLMWENYSVNPFKFRTYYSVAKKYCEDLTLGGYSDWRLPNVYELITIIEPDDNYFGGFVEWLNNAIGMYWSSTKIDENIYYIVGHSVNNQSQKVWSGYDREDVRCVRGKQLNFENLVSLMNNGKVTIIQDDIDFIKKNVKKQH